MKKDRKTPTEDEIGALLSRIQPRPGPGFHQRMANQPWNRQKRASLWTGFTPLRAAGTLGLVVLLVLGVSILFPSADTLAQRLSQFFAPSPSPQIRLAIDPRATSHPEERFNLSVSEAEAQAEFDLQLPESLPVGFALTGAFYDELRQAVILNYTANDAKLVMRLSQQYLGPDYQSIGPEAVIESVKVGTFAGEYVAGGWMIPVPEVKSGAEAEASTPTPQLVWDAAVNLQTLRWSDGEYLYEIIFAGSAQQPAYLDKEALIALAAGLH
ncbi:MAG TPA: hypothetical protein DEH22_00555 [Chloroflexi bacterium]|nr:hypothetical protein [Chloroflexota bacterium]